MSNYQWYCHPRTLISSVACFFIFCIAIPVSAQIMDSPAEIAQRKLAQQMQQAKPKPYEISSRIHLNKGTQEGYLVVEVQLAAGKHIYSLTQAGDVPPTTLKMSPNQQIQLTGVFSSDKPAVVIENHPVFQQRVEKHTGKVQFFAPIKVAATADLAKLVAEVQFDGQVCSKVACTPIRGKKVTERHEGSVVGAVEAGLARVRASGSHPEVRRLPAGYLTCQIQWALSHIAVVAELVRVQVFVWVTTHCDRYDEPSIAGWAIKVLACLD